ncbi:NAD(P)/FAD-dependent oxidoreductase [Endomicrobium proavitum]|uniref:Aminoacetone oxidase family FAD-binding enzyme n=1 Tax=Endomicrobium proavitum TaxID=1408281 RepID=A0A0G3WKS6_9BACT|nr:aminoacetone oxidase family FAD-binding enzyme [Endomicrobium proavitum]AKL98089.1 hypothetical protein Epro_0710 [Endomicrobium proavitum]
MKEKIYDAAIVGAGASGLFLGAHLNLFGDVCIIEKELNAAKKLNVSGGGKCNFSNRNIGYKNYVCSNERFVKSALCGYTTEDFLEFLKNNNIEIEERNFGRLFLKESAMQLSNVFIKKCLENNCLFLFGKEVVDVEKKDDLFILQIEDSNKNIINIKARNAVIASGGLALNGTKFAIDLAEKFGIKTFPLRAALVAAVIENNISDMSGISLNVKVSFGKHSFYDGIVFTQAGLSGPAIYQISLYANSGDTISIDFLPDVDIASEFAVNRNKNINIESVIANYLPKRLAKAFVPQQTPTLSNCSKKDLENITANVKNAKFKISSLENYNKAEVMSGGVSTDDISSQTMESKKVKGLYFTGEALDVTGQLGGYNLHWAWASAYAVVKELQNKKHGAANAA